MKAIGMRSGLRAVMSGMLLVSLLAGLALFGSDLWVRLGRSGRATDVSSIAVARGLGTLLGELQRERNLSVRYVQAGGADASIDLRSQWSRSDRALEDLRGLFAGVDAGALSPELRAAWDGAGTGLAALESRRQSVEFLMLYPIQLRRFYGDIVDALMRGVEATTGWFDDARLSAAASSYASLIELSEQVALERDLVASASSRENIAPDKIGVIVNQQGRRRDAFLSHASAAGKALFRESVSVGVEADLDAARVVGLRELHSGHLETPVARRWMGAIAAMGAALDTVMNRVSANLESAAAAVTPRFTMVQASSGAAVTLIAFFGIFWSLLRPERSESAAVVPEAAGETMADSTADSTPVGKRLGRSNFALEDSEDERLRRALDRLGRLRRKLRPQARTA